jgi:ABC-type transport system substrate-binding protein
MSTKRVLIFAPLIMTLFLLQSYFWVPTYQQQARGNPERYNEYITGSIGDAAIINPILSADSASSEIESKVFEGLIDRDENLQFRGRLAKSWQISEDAYFYVNGSAAIPGGIRPDARNIVALLDEARQNDNLSDKKLKKSLANIKKISLISPQDLSTTRQIRDPNDNRKKIEVKIDAAAPARIKLHLEQVDQDLFENLTGLLGQDYFHSFSPDKFLTTHPELPRPQLLALAAEVLPAVEHNPVIEFNLRPDVAFHDGYIFDARDVKFTYEAILNPKNISPRIADYEPVKSVEVINPLTVRIVYKRLYSPAIGTWAMGILPEHLLNDAALKKEALARGLDPATFSMRQSLFNRHPIGCGPFKFNEWKSDQYIILDRFNAYWEGPPNYHKYVFRVIPDLLTQEMEFYAGTLDNYDVQPYQVERFKNDPRFQSFSGTSFGYTYIGYNMRREPFNDVRVRRALGMAIDVNKIIRYVLDNQAERITGPFAKQTDYYNHDVKPLPYDPQGALKLLAEAGWKPNSQGWLEKNGRPLQFTLITNSGNDIRKAILAIAQDAWKQIGINVQTDLLEWSVFIQERVNKLDFDALVLGWSMGIEPDLYQIWHSSQTGPQQLNFVGFKNHKADELIVKIRQDYDHRTQVEYCHQLHALIAREQPYTFLYVGKWTAILDKRIVIKEVNAAGKIVYKKITPTKTGNFQYYFNQWIKLPKMPELAS